MSRIRTEQVSGVHGMEVCTGTRVTEQGKERAWPAASGVLGSQLQAGGITSWDLSAVSRGNTAMHCHIFFLFFISNGNCTGIGYLHIYYSLCPITNSVFLKYFIEYFL